MDSEKSRRGVVCLVVALTSCIVLAAAVTYLELKRDVQIDAIVRTVNFLEREVERLKRDLGAVREELKQERNHSASLRDYVKSFDINAKTSPEEDEYYDTSFDEEYDDADEVAEKGGKSGVNNKAVSAGRRRRRRAIGDVSQTPPVVNAVLKQTYKTPGNRTKNGPDAWIIVNPVRYATNPEEETIPLPTNRRPTDEGSCCQTAAAHYGGDITAVRQTKPSHYAGTGTNDSNHRMYHPEGVLREWKAADWMSDVGVESSSFSMNRGELTITDSPGLYYVYAQVYYADARDALGYKVLVNGVPFVQCTVTSPHSRHSGEIKANSCFTGGLINLHRGDRLSIVEVEGYRYTLVESSRTFFGLFRVSSARS